MRYFFSLLVLVGYITISAQSSLPFIDGGWFYHVLEKEEAGFIYLENGQVRDCFQSLHDRGWSFAGLELLTNKAQHDIAANLRLAQRAKNAGMEIALNFLYGDGLGNRRIPAGWPEDYEALKSKLYDYTYQTLATFDSAGLLPRVVKVGNEVDHADKGGFLLPHGAIYSAKFYELLAIGCQAVRDYDPSIRIIQHSYVPKDNQRFLRGLREHQVDFDIIGVSFYPHWGGYVEDLPQIIEQLARYGKDFMIVETSTPWSPAEFDELANTSRFEASTYGRNPLAAYLWYTNARALVAEHPLGVGFFVWPAAYPSIGQSRSTKDNQTFWSSQSGNFQALPAQGIGGQAPLIELYIRGKGFLLLNDQDQLMIGPAEAGERAQFSIQTGSAGKLSLLCLNNGRYLGRSIDGELKVTASCLDEALFLRPQDCPSTIYADLVGCHFSSTEEYLGLDDRGRLRLSESAVTFFAFSVNRGSP
ncbi:MAG: glycosyl hydrolase 53 family protein [Bacteroidota bacterium]